MVYLGLGSNVGDRSFFLESARKRLQALPQTTLVAVSSVMENKALTTPGSNETQGDYLNQVAALLTSLEPEAFFAHLMTIETELGRVRTHKWSSRTIDLDLLLFGNIQLDTGTLTVPHPQMRHRRFVLEPLFELAPDLVLPNGESLRSLL